MEPAESSDEARPIWPTVIALVVTGLLLVLAGCERGHGTSPRVNAPPSVSAPAPQAHSAAAAAVTPLALAEARAFLGDAACAPCHADICRQFAGTAHANTLRRVNEQSFGALFRSEQVLRDRVIGYTYRPGVHGKRCVLVCKGEAGEIEAPADLAVGRGHSGITFLGNVSGDDWATLRLSYYTTRRAWKFSPGQNPGNEWQPAIGQRLGPGDVVACLSCHVTYLRATGGRLDVGASQLGVGCERCHGSGRQHVESARLAMAGKAVPVALLGNGPIKDPAHVEALCGPCHSATEEPAHPGNVGSIREIERFQTTALEASRCYRESRGLTCVTCHNPHTDVVPGKADIDKVCMRCHTGSITPPVDARVASGAGKPCPISATTGCVRCHMPSAQFPDVPSLPFHNHWIKVWAKTGKKGNRQAGE